MKALTEFDEQYLSPLVFSFCQAVFIRGLDVGDASL